MFDKSGFGPSQGFSEGKHAVGHVEKKTSKGGEPIGESVWYRERGTQCIWSVGTIWYGGTAGTWLRYKNFGEDGF